MILACEDYRDWIYAIMSTHDWFLLNTIQKSSLLWVNKAFILDD